MCVGRIPEQLAQHRPSSSSSSATSCMQTVPSMGEVGPATKRVVARRSLAHAVPNGALRLAFLASAFIAVHAANDEPEIVKAFGYGRDAITTHDGYAILLKVPQSKLLGDWCRPNRACYVPCVEATKVALHFQGRCVGRWAQSLGTIKDGKAATLLDANIGLMMPFSLCAVHYLDKPLVKALSRFVLFPREDIHKLEDVSSTQGRKYAVGKPRAEHAAALKPLGDKLVMMKCTVKTVRSDAKKVMSWRVGTKTRTMKNSRIRSLKTMRRRTMKKRQTWKTMNRTYPLLVYIGALGT